MQICVLIRQNLNLAVNCLLWQAGEGDDCFDTTPGQSLITGLHIPKYSAALLKIGARSHVEKGGSRNKKHTNCFTGLCCYPITSGLREQNRANSKVQNLLRLTTGKRVQLGHA